ncbi:hypothetical protein GDO81_014117 [Engystomops pustulosus]|uniref:Uncharacterized protein n=1 Tax=Engystomops pustulosus TaxID=76066 RepID=A0AAV7B842_ENGPU|nr:hypothetical protein GDO81_014117 [Engystomops pustulosus]
MVWVLYQEIKDPLSIKQKKDKQHSEIYDEMILCLFTHAPIYTVVHCMCCKGDFFIACEMTAANIFLFSTYLVSIYLSFHPCNHPSHIHLTILRKYKFMLKFL